MHIINRKQFILILGLLVISITAYSKAIIDIQTWDTEKGSKVLFTQTHELPILDITVSFYAGSIHDNKNYGLANFTNSMLSAGTNTLNANQIADNFDRIGAIFYTYITPDASNLCLRCLTEPKVLNSALQTFSMVLSGSIFPEAEIRRIKKQTLIAIQEKNQDPSSVAIDEFNKTLYGDFPYGHPEIGTAETVSAINRKKIQDFYHQYYTAKNAVVIIVGDVSRTQAEKITNQITAKLPIGQHMQLSLVNLKNKDALTKNIEFPSTQTNVVMGQIGIARNDQDYIPLGVGNFILGGSLTSDLFLEVREKLGLVYHVRSRFVDSLYPGAFKIFLSTSNEKAENAIQVVTNILKKFVQNGPTEKQLVAAKKSLTGQLPLMLASNYGILHALWEIGFYHLPLDYLDTYIDKTNVVTLKQIQDAFQHHLDLNKMLLICVGKFNKK